MICPQPVIDCIPKAVWSKYAMAFSVWCMFICNVFIIPCFRWRVYDELSGAFKSNGKWEKNCYKLCTCSPAWYGNIQQKAETKTEAKAKSKAKAISSFAKRSSSWRLKFDWVKIARTGPSDMEIIKRATAILNNETKGAEKKVIVFFFRAAHIRKVSNKKFNSNWLIS